MEHKCSWPGCSYSTFDRSKIDFHHVVPRSIDKSRKNKLTIPLCPTHHAMIFHPQVKSGRHSQLSEGSLEVLAILKTTDDDVIHYRNPISGREFFYQPTSGLEL